MQRISLLIISNKRLSRKSIKMMSIDAKRYHCFLEELFILFWCSIYTFCWLVGRLKWFFVLLHPVIDLIMLIVQLQEIENYKPRITALSSKAFLRISWDHCVKVVAIVLTPFIFDPRVEICCLIKFESPLFDFREFSSSFTVLIL